MFRRTIGPPRPRFGSRPTDAWKPFHWNTACRSGVRPYTVQAVFRYLGQGNSWEQVGGPASELYGGDFGLVATSPVNGNLFLFIRPLQGPHSRELIGGPGAQFAVAQDTVFGLTPDKQAVFRYDGVGTSWTKVGGPADSIIAFVAP